MKNRNKKVLFALMLGCSITLMATGCDKLKKEPETETEAPTEAPTEKQTETETESETQSETQTETETESETQSETQPQNLTADEELAQAKEYDQLKTMYAKDDINVRTKPGTDDSSEIFSSFAQGDQIVVVGETPNWYEVDVDGYEDHGYVSKQFVSAEVVAPKTDEERQQAIEQELSGQTATDTDSAAASTTTASSSDSSSVDAEYGVGAFAESFPIQAATGANVRKTPSQDGEIIQTIGSGETVTALGETDRWYKVDINGTIGYVNKNLFNAQ